MLRRAVLLVALFATLAPAAPPRTQRLSIRTEDGVTLAATWYEPSHRPAPAVVLVHMLQRNRRDWDALASRLSSEGIGTLTIDLRGHGESSGDPSALAAMAQDVRAARRHLGARSDVLSSRIGIAGASLGANLAVLAAAEEPAIASLALVSPSLDYRGVRIEAAMRKYGSRPALLVAGDDDPYALRTAKELQKAGGGIRELLVLPQAGHGMHVFSRAPDVSRQLIDWFRRTIE